MKTMYVHNVHVNRDLSTQTPSHHVTVWWQRANDWPSVTNNSTTGLVSDHILDKHNWPQTCYRHWPISL